jgi:hypothetical protein
MLLFRLISSGRKFIEQAFRPLRNLSVNSPWIGCRMQSPLQIRGTCGQKHSRSPGDEALLTKPLHKFGLRLFQL